MPTKFAKSFKQIDRATKKETVVHSYIKTMSVDSLFEELNKDNTKPKVKQKIRNEIVRRGYRIVRRPKDAEE
tara:strand:- start:110 stop:325 length:216 start_codon:yes stop_codon:yes gene_type:complete